MSLNSTISITKGFGILLMVLGHATMNSVVLRYISMFHMPLFFLMAGYCFRDKYLSDGKTFVFRRVKGLYLPYLKWGLLFLVLHNVFCLLHIYGDAYTFDNGIVPMYTWMDMFIQTIKTLLFMGNEQLLGGYWFLRELFLASIFGWLTLKLIKHRSHRILLWLMVSIASVVVDLKILKGSTCLGTLFYLIGYNLKEKIPVSIQVLLLTLVITIIGTIFFPSHIRGCTIVSIIPYVIVAVCGTVMVYNVSWLLGKYKGNKIVKFMTYCGEHTLEILTWHFISFRLVSLLIITIYDLPIGMLSYYPVIPEFKEPFWWVVYFIVGVGLPLIMVRVVEQFKQRNNNE